MNEREKERRESEIIGATSKTREPRGYPRGNVIGSWARGGPFGGALWIGEGGVDDRQSVVSTRGRVCAALSRPKARPPKPRGAYFTNDRPPSRSVPLSQCTRTRTPWHTPALTISPSRDAMREKKRRREREAYLSATSSAGPAGEMKLDHLYWVVPSRRRRSVFDDGSRDTHRPIRCLWQQEDWRDDRVQNLVYIWYTSNV